MADLQRLSDEEIIRHLPDEVLLQHIQGQKTTEPIGGVAETIGAPQSPTPRTFFPASVGLQQASARHPVIANLPFMRAGAAGLDVLRNVGAAVNTPLETARTASEGGGFHPIESYLRELRGGRIEPTIEQERMKQATNIGVGMIPFGGLVSRGAKAVESLPFPRLPRFQQPIETVEEVLRVPEARLPKLTQKERGAYFQARSQQISEQFKTQRLALKEEQVALGKELGKATRERSLYVREQLPALYSKQSSHYRALVDRELAPVANDLIPDNEIRGFLNNRFAHDPERLNAVSAKMGLGNEPAKPILSQVVDDLGRQFKTGEIPESSHKIGELYQKSLDFGQELPRAVRESLRVYSPQDSITDDAIDSLVEFLGTKNVNLPEARSFWRGWAPIRNQATREFRPFLEPDIATQAGGARLAKLAKGIDPHNELYAKTLTDLLEIDDLPGGVIRNAIGKLDANKKTQLALTLQQQEATGALQAMKFRVNQIADKEQRRWTKIKWIIGVIGVGGAAKSAVGIMNQP